MKAYHKMHRRQFLGALVSVLISTIFAVALQFFKGDVLDCAVAGNVSGTVRYTALLIGFILGEIASYYLFQRLSAKYAVGCIRALRQDLFDSILRRSFIDFKSRAQGEYLSKFTAEAEAIRDRHFRMLPMLWEILFRIVLVSAALFRLDWRIALITIALLTTPLYIPKLIESRLQQAQSAYLQAMENSLARITDWLRGFEIIKNYAVEDQIRAQFKAADQDAMEKLLRDTGLGALSQLITTLISYLSYFAVLCCAAWLVLRGDFSPGDFFVAIGMIDQLSYPLISLAGILRQLVAIRPTCRSMEAFLAQPPVVRTGPSVRALRDRICLKNVSFSYDGQRRILDGFSLTMEKGKHYLLKGPSGCGKTTAINLLLRYFEPSAGQIEIDGVPLALLGSTYSLVTVVRQEATLFRDTLRNNLTMYRDVPPGRLNHVLHSVGLARFANPDALDTQVSEGGANFSGGEKARICLARALLRDTQVLILDEPLANLDAQTAGRIEDLLLSIRDRTVLIVSHQFTHSKLSRFDRVVDLTPS